jgi:CheR methyltransferase, SAM binding domain
LFYHPSCSIRSSRKIFAAIRSIICSFRSRAIFGLRACLPLNALGKFNRHHYRWLAKRDRRFRLLDHDLLAGAPFPVPVDVVRVMNVLNSSYFSDQDLARTVGRIFDSLGEGGLLVVGSNEEAGSQVRGAIYRKVNGGFAELARSGAAHDAHRAIVGYSPSAAA